MQTPFLRIGTRGSKLALFQANLVKKLISEAHQIPEDEINIHIIKTTGDRVVNRPLSEIGGKGLFTKEIEDALLESQIDLAVHSMKDMAAKLPSGLEIAAVLEREDPRDAFLSTKANSVDALPPGSRIGCSSVRRVAQVLSRRPDLKILPFRGNVDTRIQKLKEGQVEATFLASAGLNRLGLKKEITQLISTKDMLPAPAQGIIGIEIRSIDARIKEILRPLNHKITENALIAERAFLESIDGSCRTPIAAHATIIDNQIDFRAEAFTYDGSIVFKTQRNGSLKEALEIGQNAADEIKFLSRGKLNL